MVLKEEWCVTRGHPVLIHLQDELAQLKSKLWTEALVFGILGNARCSSQATWPNENCQNPCEQYTLCRLPTSNLGVVSYSNSTLRVVCRCWHFSCAAGSMPGNTVSMCHNIISPHFDTHVMARQGLQSNLLVNAWENELKNIKVTLTLNCWR